MKCIVMLQSLWIAAPSTYLHIKCETADLGYPPHAPLGDHTPVAVEPEQRPAAHHRAVHEADHPGPGGADPVCQVLGPVNVDQVQTLSLGYPARLFVSAIISGFSCC